nr:hypothetical protein HK105_004124 [Polyrhizophydium stewartii]
MSDTSGAHGFPRGPRPMHPQGQPPFPASRAELFREPPYASSSPQELPGAPEAGMILQRPRDWDGLQRLSGTLYGSAASYGADAGDAGGIEEDPFWIQFLKYCLAKYTAISVTVPFENAIMLRQVQFVPDDDYVHNALSGRPGAGGLADAAGTAAGKGNAYDVSDSEGSGTASGNSDGEEGGSSVSDEDDRSFFDADDYANRLGKKLRQESRGGRQSARHMRKAAADSSGYLLRSTFDDDDPTRPTYQLPTLRASTFSTIYKIASFNDEGIASLWKGHMALFCKAVAFSWTQPTVSSLLASAFNVPLDDTPLTYAEQPLPQIGLLLASHAITGVMTSPLELVQTRLFGAVFKHMGPLIIERWLGFGRDEAPSAHFVCSIAFGLLELLVMLPIETPNPRKYGALEEREFQTAVAIAPIPYVGVVDCAMRIMAEEGWQHSNARHAGTKGVRRARRGSRAAGSSSPKRAGILGTWMRVSGLYRGFGARLATLISVVCLQALVQAIDVEE